MLVFRPPTNPQQWRKCWCCWWNVGRYTTNYVLASIMCVLGVLVGPKELDSRDRRLCARATNNTNLPTSSCAAVALLPQPLYVPPERLGAFAKRLHHA